jgi:hypothetical protein
VDAFCAAYFAELEDMAVEVTLKRESTAENYIAISIT